MSLTWRVGIQRRKYLEVPGWGLGKENPAIGPMRDLHLCSVATVPIVPARCLMTVADRCPLARSSRVLGCPVLFP